MTLITALEIFGNPLDLMFSVKQIRGVSNYGVLINRGPGHNFKLLLSGEMPSKKQALECVNEVLETAIKHGRKGLPEFGGVAENCLTEKQKEEILASLEKTGECHTYKK